ncbi:hypothetical protein [Spirosoma spitsbergense]|uniref:hypothetical protein n=1 Tax=Spirosoma spitsbergense TaxID=431554 RepID=UPI0003668A82|nr:hypothetical protein [Spirosoma spitsbergense]
MNKIEKLNLIEGNFSKEEAREILMSIFSSKINFHRLKNFSSQERYGKQDETAQKRLPELKKEIEKVLQIVSEAKSKNKRLLITSEIVIQLSDD